MRRESAGRDRIAARTAYRQSFRPAPFRYVRRVPSSTITHVSLRGVSSTSRRPQAPRFIPDSRISPAKAGLATLAFLDRPSHYHRSLNADSYTPLATMVYPSAQHITAVTSFTRLRVRSCAALVPAKRREPLCPQQVLPLALWPLAPHQKTLLLLHRSYWLMRQTKTLPLTPALASFSGSLQVAVSPCWPPARRDYGSERRWPFPTLSLQSLRRCLDPYPAVFPWCICSLLPRRQRPHLKRHKFGTPICPVMQLQPGIYFGAAVPAAAGFRLPRSLDLQVAPTAKAQRLQGSQAVYTTHSSVGYLPRNVASLRVRHEQLTRLDFHQLDCSLVGCSNVHK
jgi:hypothetical protein